MTKYMVQGAAAFAWACVFWSCAALEHPPVRYRPEIDPAGFTNVIDNPFFTMRPGTTFVYKSSTDEGMETNRVTVTDDTRKVMGVATRVVWDRVWLDDDLIEETCDWYAQDEQGNVWYFGEDSKEYRGGKIVSTRGSWEAGRGGAMPGIVMKAGPQTGAIYRQEYYKGEAEDMAEVVGLQESVSVPYGTFDNCLKTKDWSPLEHGVVEYKYYSPVTGCVVLETGKGGTERVELIDIVRDDGSKAGRKM